MSDTVARLAADMAVRHVPRVEDAVDTYPPGAYKMVQCRACDGDLWRMWRPSEDGEVPQCEFWRRAHELGVL